MDGTLEVTLWAKQCLRLWMMLDFDAYLQGRWGVGVCQNGQNALFKIAAKLVFRTNARQTMLQVAPINLADRI